MGVEVGLPESLRRMAASISCAASHTNIDLKVDEVIQEPLRGSSIMALT